MLNFWQCVYMKSHGGFKQTPSDMTLGGREVTAKDQANLDCLMWLHVYDICTRPSVTLVHELFRSRIWLSNQSSDLTWSNLENGNQGQAIFYHLLWLKSIIYHQINKEEGIHLLDKLIQYTNHLPINNNMKTTLHFSQKVKWLVNLFFVDCCETIQLSRLHG